MEAANPHWERVFHTSIPSIPVCSRVREGGRARMRVYARAGIHVFSMEGMEVWKSLAPQGFPVSIPFGGGMGGMEMADLEQMRLDFPLAAKAEEWTAEDQAAIGEAIKAAIAAEEDEALAYWARRIGEAAARWRALCERVRAIEADIKAMRAA